MKKEKWQKINREEQESIMLIDYAYKEVNIYTAREAVYNRLVKVVGIPTITFYDKGKITGASWKIAFTNKKIAKLFSKKLLIRKYKIKYIY